MTRLSVRRHIASFKRKRANFLEEECLIIGRGRISGLLDIKGRIFGQIFGIRSNFWPDIRYVSEIVYIIRLDIKFSTICLRSSYPFYIVSYYINWVTTSWKYNISENIELPLEMQ